PGFPTHTTRQAPARPFDLVVLGDSFGVGDGTSQEQTWASVLAREHNLAAYNLSMDGASPWQEYVNFLLEGERLRLRPGTLVAWVFFTGNDLDDLYLPAYERAQLPWRSRAAQLRDAVRNFRYNSPLRRLLSRRDEPAPRADVAAATLPDRRTLLFSRAYAQSAARTAADVERHPHFAQLQATIGAMKRLTDAR